jgi:MscS family membrane protein
VLGALTRILHDYQKVEPGGLPVRFTGIGSYSLDIEIFAYIRTLNGDEFLKIQQDLLLLIMDAVKAAGTALALPTQATVSYPLPAPSANGSSLPELASSAKDSRS